MSSFLEMRVCPKKLTNYDESKDALRVKGILGHINRM